MTPSEENPNQLPAPNGVMRTIEQKPATVSVRAGTSVLSDIGNNAITERAENIRHSDDESMIWQETPSMVLLIPHAIRYVILLIVVFAACGIVNRTVSRTPAARFVLEHSGIHVSPAAPEAVRHVAHKLKSSRHASADDTATPTDDSTSSTDSTAADDTEQPQGLTLRGILLWVKLAFTALFAVLMLLYWFKLKTTKYSASSQRLIVEEGSWHSVNRPYELHQLGDAVIHKPALLRMFNVSNLEFVTPPIQLYGLRNAEYVRDVLRQGGQIEAQRTDKIRWR